jgi:hypothetical protein
MRYRWDPVYPNYVVSGRRRMPSDDADLRASDAERSQVADRLSHHYTEGRLDQAEFNARMDKAMGAVTRGDLDGLFDDLPAEAGESDRRTPTRPRLRGPVRIAVVALLVVLVAGWVLSLAQAPWVLIVVVALYLWHRSGRREGGIRVRDQSRR